MTRLLKPVFFFFPACLLSLSSPAWSQPPGPAAGREDAAFLMEALWNPEARVRQNAVKLLSELDERPYDDLVKHLESGSPIEAATAAVVLEQMTTLEVPLPESVRGELYRILEIRPAVPWRWNITATLLAGEPGSAGDSLKDHIDLWIWGVEHPSPFMQLPSLRALERMGSDGQAAEEPLLALLNRPRRPLTSLVIDPQVIADQLIGIEQSIPDYDALTILETLVAIEADANRLLGPLTRLTRHDSEYVRLDAASMLGKIKTSEPQSEPARQAAEVLSELATNRTGNVRVAAVKQLGEIDGAVEERLSVLGDLLLEDRNDDVRLQAARSLGSMGSAAMPALEKLERALRFAKLDTQDAERVIADAIAAIKNPTN